MNCWDELELLEGADKKAVKRAYARKLKLIDVQENPAAFQRLRQSYETALAYLEDASQEDEKGFSLASDIQPQLNSYDGGVPVSESETDEHDVEAGSAVELANFPSDVEESFDPYLIAQRVMEDVESLTANEDRKSDINAWKEIFSGDALLDFDVLRILRFWVFEFVAERLGASDWNETAARTIDRQVVRYLNQVFSWHQEQLSLAQYYDSLTVAAVMYEIDGNKASREFSRKAEKEKQPVWMMIVGWVVVLICLTNLFKSITS